LEDANKSLACSSTNQKFLFRKARALTFLDDEEEAMKILKGLPSNADIVDAIEECKERIN
jgi:hypothetical protein